MWSFEIKPRAVLHISDSRNLVRYYVVDIFLSSFVVERHIFSNCRSFRSYLNGVQKVMPWFHNEHLSLSFDNYIIFAEDLTDEFVFKY